MLVMPFTSPSVATRTFTSCVSVALVASLTAATGYAVDLNPAVTASLALVATAVTSITSVGPSTPVASQATAGFKPTLVTDTTGNGQPYLLHDGSDDRLVNTDYSLAQAATIFLVASCTVQTSRFIIDGYNLGQRMAVYGYDATNVGMYAAGAELTGVANLTALTIYEAVFNGASSVLLLNGVQKASGNPGTNGYTTGFVLGGRGDQNLPNMWSGKIFRTLIYSGAMSASERAIVRQLLATRYGIAV